MTTMSHFCRLSKILNGGSAGGADVEVVWFWDYVQSFADIVYC